jgi:hypothetical protein
METTIREPDQIRQDCAKKLLAVIRGPKLRAVLGYFLGEVLSIPSILDLRLTDDGRIVARLEGESDFRADLSSRHKLILCLHKNGAQAGLDGDELGYLLAQVAKIKREE